MRGETVDLTEGGIAYLEGRKELPPKPTNNEEAARRVNDILKEIGLEQTGFDILDVLVAHKSGFNKGELAKEVGKAQTTKSFSNSLTFLAKLNILTKGKKYTITSVYVPS